MTADVFDLIYRRNKWRGQESLSGPGSGTAATRMVAAELAVLVDSLGVESVLDFGCGDGYWMPDLPGYIGYDPTRRAVDRAMQNHPDRTYTNDLPRGTFGLVILRDVIQHLSFDTALATIARATARSSGYLIVSHYTNGFNRDIDDGGFYSPSMISAPFSMPEPSRLIFDGYHYHETEEIRDPGKYLALWDLR